MVIHILIWCCLEKHAVDHALVHAPRCIFAFPMEIDDYCDYDAHEWKKLLAQYSRKRRLGQNAQRTEYALSTPHFPRIPPPLFTACQLLTNSQYIENHKSAQFVSIGAISQQPHSTRPSIHSLEFRFSFTHGVMRCYSAQCPFFFMFVYNISRKIFIHNCFSILLVLCSLVIVSLVAFSRSIVWISHLSKYIILKDQESRCRFNFEMEWMWSIFAQTVLQRNRNSLK